MKTSRGLLLWATVACIFAGMSDGAQAQTRRFYPLQPAMSYQARRGMPHSSSTQLRPHTAPSTNAPRPVANNGSSAQAPIERRPPQPPAGSPAASPPTPAPAAGERRDVPMMSANRARGGGEHLSEWMNQHSNLNPTQQQQALEKEPGFRELPGKTQQRLRDQLTQLNNMPPQQRARWVARTEAMEKLTPDQRAQVRGAMQQLASLPPDQRVPVQRSFRQLRDLPPDQRSSAINSDRYRGQLNPAQRATLNNLMRVEPMLEPPEPKMPASPQR